MQKKKDLVKEPIIESNEIARARISPPPNSVWEWRIINLVVAKNRENDKAFTVLKISFKELAGGKPLSNDQHRQIKKAVFDLGHTTVVIPQQTHGICVIPVFNLISINDDGDIAAEINYRLKPHYLGLEENFMLYALPEFRGLSSVYSQILFRYLHSWKNLDNGEKTTPLGELHELLSTPPSFRKDFKAFRKYALEPSYKEITEKTNLDYEWEPIKAGLRKVVAIRFIFNPVAARLKEKKALEGQEARANEETEKIRAEANHCFIEYKNIRQECTPKMRTKRCKYCTGERGLKYNYPELQRKKCDA